MGNIGKRLKYLRERQGLSVSTVAEALGIAVSTYRDWENGRAIQGEPYVKMARVFDTSLSYLLTGEHPSPSELRRAYNLLIEAVEIIRQYDRSL